MDETLPKYTIRDLITDDGGEARAAQTVRARRKAMEDSEHVFSKKDILFIVLAALAILCFGGFMVPLAPKLSSGSDKQQGDHQVQERHLAARCGLTETHWAAYPDSKSLDTVASSSMGVTKITTVFSTVTVVSDHFSTITVTAIPPDAKSVMPQSSLPSTPGFPVNTTTSGKQEGLSNSYSRTTPTTTVSSTTSDTATEPPSSATAQPPVPTENVLTTSSVASFETDKAPSSAFPVTASSMEIASIPGDASLSKIATVEPPAPSSFSASSTEPNTSLEESLGVWPNTLSAGSTVSSLESAPSTPTSSSLSDPIVDAASAPTGLLAPPSTVYSTEFVTSLFRPDFPPRSTSTTIVVVKEGTFTAPIVTLVTTNG
ncbi:hypothetical protein LTR05_004671 [Lithohypha guttulata]|uniref:Uncharacterized protein n=1 Tax=Lithohypha guttulata TaxID=1690604 RepID=A0AAN7SZ64_9EURO|nr:hypothetical protein LTR05_004671 [Lithohypha guttulata]